MVGLTVTAALTDYMSMTTYRGNKSKMIELEDGILVEHSPKNTSEFRFGTSVTIIPSEKYLGSIELTNDIMENFLRNMSYIIEKDVIITLVMEKDPSDKKTKLVTKEYTGKGLAACCKYLSSSLETDPITVKYICEDYDLSMAFSFDRTIDDIITSSYCNYIITTERGCHELAATRAICEYFTREGKRQDPNNKYEITFDDCRKGLILAVNLEHVAPKFEGQHKSKVSNVGVDTDGKRGLVNVLSTQMQNNPAIQKKIITYLRQISKIRMEANKIKGVSTKKGTTFLEDGAIKKFFTTSNRNSTEYRELFLAEGDSAAGAILNSRNPRFQAVYTVEGVTDNVHDLSLTQLLQKRMFRDLIQILGCGVGKDYNIDNLRYNKIIICTDSDVDGKNIASLILCFFFIFMPELIENGKIYKALPPLYQIDGKALKKKKDEQVLLNDKSEYYNLINTITVNNVEVAIDVSKTPTKRNADLEVLNKPQLMTWLQMNSEYFLELDNLGKKSGTDISILETVCYLKSICKNEKEFSTKIISAFPEMTYDLRNKSLIGALDGEHLTLICDSLFDKNATRFMRQLNNNPTPYVWYRKKNTDDKLTRVTIGEFFQMIEKTYGLDIIKRFKGVGEAKLLPIFRTITNPKLRSLVRLDVSDISKTIEVFELIHGKSIKLREARRALLDSVQLSYADIDN